MEKIILRNAFGIHFKRAIRLWVKTPYHDSPQPCNSRLLSLLTALFVLTRLAAESAPGDILVADFEGDDYGAWKVEGTAFGTGPARGTLPGQMAVEGFVGKRLVNSFVGGDDSVGKLTSPPFKIERRFIGFL